MHHWDRGISGRLQRVSTPVEQGCEVSVHSDQMDPLLEKQQSQSGTLVNPIAYRSMRDHIHPPRVSAPFCIIPPAEEVAVRPYLVPLLPTFMVWRMKIHIHTYGILRRYALLLRKV